MEFNGNNGTNAFARVLAQRMQKESATSLVLDFGSIGADYSLVTNTFPIPIPAADYLVCRLVSGISLETAGGVHTGHEAGDGTHSHSIDVQPVGPGDRVLVAWVNNDAIVIDVIRSASRLREG